MCKIILLCVSILLRGYDDNDQLLFTCKFHQVDDPGITDLQLASAIVIPLLAFLFLVLIIIRIILAKRKKRKVSQESKENEVRKVGL